MKNNFLFGFLIELLLTMIICFASFGSISGAETDTLTLEQFRLDWKTSDASYLSKPSPENALEMLKTAEHGKLFYPDYAEVICRYTNALMIAKADPMKALWELMPFLPVMDERPEIAASIWLVFTSWDQDGRTRSKWITLMNDTPQNTDAQIRQLRFYWASKVDPAQISDPLKELLASDKKASVANSTELLANWISFARKLYERKIELDIADYFLQLDKSARMTMEANEKKVELDLKKYSVEALLGLEQLKHAPNNLEKIEKIMQPISVYKKQIDSQALPNYDELKTELKNEKELRILEISYLVFVFNNYDAAFKLLNQEMDSDERILELKIICMTHMNKSKEDILPVVDKLLQVNHLNRRAFMLKRQFEAIDELKAIMSEREKAEKEK